MTQRWRLANQGAIDRTRPLAFAYDGTRYEGYAGDTLASALLANGIHLVGRSFKYHRPRGIYSAGVEEPNALVQLARGAHTEPNARATTVELYDGLVAQSQNCWPSVRFDVGAVANALSPLLPAGFYYKTFMWPPTPRGWLRYEHYIRRAAGMGRAAVEPDPDRYEHEYAHCDVLVIGGGIAGLSAALTAARAGARVIVCQQSPQLASSVLDGNEGSDQQPVRDWAAQASAKLAAHPDVTLLTRTTAYGYYDGNLVGAIERVTDHMAVPLPHLPRQRMWMIRAQAVVLASGAIERGIAYANNDLPGTMLAGAAHTYVRRYGVQPGSRAVVFTNHDRAYAAALALHDAGVAIAGVVDVRAQDKVTGSHAARARAAGLPVLHGCVIRRARGRLRVTGVDVDAHGGGAPRSIDCDLVAVSGGYSPAVHLFSQARGTLRYDDTSASFMPDAVTAADLPGRQRPAVRATPRSAIADGGDAARRALARVGRTLRVSSMLPDSPSLPVVAAGTGPLLVEPLWAVSSGEDGKCFVDLQDDVTVRDIALAAREGYRAGRAPEAVHDARHGHRPGQDQQRHRARADGAMRSACPFRRSARRRSARRTRRSHSARFRARPRRACRADTPLGDARLARRAGRALRQRRIVEAPAFVSAPGESRRRCGEPRSAQRARRTSASSTCRRWARSSCRDATSRSS